MKEKPWYSPRRKVFWFVLAVLLYTLLGFFAAPHWIKNTVVDLFRDDLGRLAQIENVEVNPYVLSVRVEGFELSDTDEAELASFDEFYVNFQLSSLFNWAWTFSEIRLTGPWLHFERYDSGETRLEHLLADFENSRPPVPDEEKAEPEEDGAPRLLIQNLSLNDGHVDVLDHVPETPFEIQLAPINISVSELNTLPGRHGEQVVTIQLPGDASLKWSGSLTLAPLDSEGELVLNGLHLGQAIAYLKAFLPLESISATLSSRFHYRLHLEDDELDIDITQIELDLDKLKLSGLSPVSEFADIEGVSLQGGTLKYPEQSLHFSKFVIDRPRLEAWVNEDGSLSVSDLAPEPGTEAGFEGKEDRDSPWQFGLDEFVLQGGSVALSDRSIQPVVAVDAVDLHVKVSGISNEDGVLMPLELSGMLADGGSFEMDGDLGVFPGVSATINVGVHSIPLSLGQPYVRQFANVAIENGVLNSDLEIAMPPGQGIRVGGSVQIPGLEVNDTLKEQSLLSWDTLNIDHFDFSDSGLQISQLLFKQVYARLAVHEDQTTNLSALMVESSVDRSTGEETDPMNFVIGGIRVNDGSMDFSDFSLPLPFATHIANLDGTISTIDANSDTPANLRLEGQVDEYGLARIEGSMNMLDPVRFTDVTLEFRNLLMSNLSPYTVQFAGREIDEGKLDMGLVYAIDDGQLHGENDIVLSNLVLGKKVEHPDAASLPLGLAVGLLKDSDGVIKVDLPVDGDINDPEFQIGGVIWQAFAGLITKVVSAPFRLLGNLIGIDSEDLGQFEFLAGRADLTPPELEKILQLEEALLQRPQLVVEISGVTDREIDIPALRFIRLRDVANQRLEKEVGDSDHEDMMLDDEIRALVETMFTERFPDISLQTIKDGHMAIPEGEPEGKAVLDELAYATDLWNRLLASEPVTDQDLEELANARAEAIRSAFLANDKFDESRIVISQPKTVTSEDGEWVTLELAVATD